MYTLYELTVLNTQLDKIQSEFKYYALNPHHVSVKGEYLTYNSATNNESMYSRIHSVHTSHVFKLTIPNVKRTLSGYQVSFVTQTCDATYVERYLREGLRKYILNEKYNMMQEYDKILTAI